MKLKSIGIMLIILVSLIPVYLLYRYFQTKIRPRESLKRFFYYLLAVFLLVFCYTFLLVFLIKIAFPNA